MPEQPNSGPIGEGFLAHLAFDHLYGMERQAAIDSLFEMLHDEGAIDEEFYQHLRRSPLGRVRVWKLYEAARAHERAVHAARPTLPPSSRFDGLELA
jgi:hypothetical protein